MKNLLQEIARRFTFAIISHPDAGKTTVTEKLLLFAGAVALAGTVKGRKAARHATSDWMQLEKERGISVTTSVMQFAYKKHILNLLDTPGHSDFSEDTYRTLTAVDSALMVIDGAKGVEERTIKLLEICRMRTTPIFTFINKFDRNCLEPITLLDEIETVLKIKCAPITWPIGMGSNFKGIYHIYNDQIILYAEGKGDKIQAVEIIPGLNNPRLNDIFGADAQSLRDEIALVHGASHKFDYTEFLTGRLTPVYFGSAINNFGVRELLDGFLLNSVVPQAHLTSERLIQADEAKFSGFIFKIQANMDPQHRDRIAFMRICSGMYKKGIKMHHVRLERDVQINNALTFMAGERESAECAYAGDIIGLHNHGTIQIGDSFTEGEKLHFTGIPHFAPELFRLVRLKNPLKQKALLKGLLQLSEEGATQIFRPLNSNDLILGAVGVLQFDVVAYRLKDEYGVDCAYEDVSVVTARWIESKDAKILEQFKEKAFNNLAVDGGDCLTYLAPSMINLNLTKERWPDIKFLPTREH